MKLKNLLFTALSVLLFSFNGIAQDSTDTYSGSLLFPKKGNVGVGLVFDGLIDNITLGSNKNNYGQNILFAKYYAKDDVALRLGFGLNLDSYKRHTADSVGLTLNEVDSTFNRYLVNVSFGIEKHLFSTKRLDPFIFTQADLTFIGKSNSEVEEKVTSSAGTATTIQTIKRDGGLAFGLRAGGGLNYFISQRFSLGTELALVFQYVKEGGTISNNTLVTPINGSSTSDIIKREDQVNRANVDVQPSAQLNISYFF